jgi:hypothetical protein
MVSESFASSNPSTALFPSVPSSSGTLTVKDLRLMHHWSTNVWNTLGVREEGFDNVIRFTATEFAFENDFMMNAVLGIASLHMQQFTPDSGHIRKETDVYRTNALAGFRQALTQLQPDSKHYEASLLMSLLVVIMCSQDYSTNSDDLTSVL